MGWADAAWLLLVVFVGAEAVTLVRPIRCVKTIQSRLDQTEKSAKEAASWEKNVCAGALAWSEFY